jgi:predicted NBD/HSP70 family sugar kinase
LADIRATELCVLEQASDLADQGDRAATEIFANAGEALGRTISHFATIMAPPRLILFGPPQLMHYAEIESARAFLDGVRRGRSAAILGPKSDLVSRVLYPITLPTASAAMAVRYCHLHSRYYVLALLSIGMRWYPVPCAELVA